MRLNKKEYMDKLYACWIGKNIGGTLGTPFEGKREILNLKGFSTPKGEPLPNDDLDLQLVWLTALEETGIKNFSANVLAEYWLERITPHWNEYGIAKTNLMLGFMPPMSGELDNDKWKTSNGAWIRSEIWAGISPGIPDVAVKYAVMDAMVDHGLSEGTYAEIFTACMQSTAYIESNIEKLIETALAKIPEECAVAETVRLVMNCYHRGINYIECREKVIELNKESGWFQAPGNIGFAVIGLLYGEGDFKKSVIYAVNCGDDTDCTAATVGATLGIMGGTKAIPDDWKEFIGERIVTVSINGSYNFLIPKTCTELTERVAVLVPEVMKDNRIDFNFVETASDFSEEKELFNNLKASDYLNFSRYSYDYYGGRTLKVKVEFDRKPYVKSGETRKVKLTFNSVNTQAPQKLKIKLILPESWECGNYEHTVALDYKEPFHNVKGCSVTEFCVTAGDKIHSQNRIYAEIMGSNMIFPIMVPIIFIG